MENFNQLINAIESKVELVWNDPDPIEGNDYTITKIEDIKELLKDFDETDEDIVDDFAILIQYGGGSEAEVFLHEICIK